MFTPSDTSRANTHADSPGSVDDCSNPPSKVSTTRKRGTKARMTPANKRKRVTLACDNCKKRRDKCDGKRPSCKGCAEQNLNCEYTPSSMRRGIQPGYIGTLECCLAYLLEQPKNDAHLSHLLEINANDSHPRRGRLQQRWTNSWFRKMLVNLPPNTHLDAPQTATYLSEKSDCGLDKQDDGASCNDRVNEVDRTQSRLGVGDEKTLESTMLQQQPLLQIQTPGRVLHLPENWRLLLDTYVSQTHTWLPILNSAALWESALSFPVQGLQLEPDSVVPSSYIELWAALALASFQASGPNANHGERGEKTPLQSRSLYVAARFMMPSEDKSFELSHVRALLLHSLVLTGQGKGLAAWMLVGTAVRLALHLQATGVISVGQSISDEREGDQDPLSTGTKVFAGCVVINAFSSATLSQSTFLDLDLTALDSAMGTVLSAPWMDVSNLHSLRPFQQLYKNARVLEKCLRIPKSGASASQRGQLQQALIQELYPEFAFCSSVIVGNTTPATAANIILHVSFLITLAMTADKSQRFTLLCSLCNVLERSNESLGAHGTPPVVLGLLNAIWSSADAELQSSPQRLVFERTRTELRAVWTQRRLPPLDVAPLSEDAWKSCQSHKMPTPDSSANETISLSVLASKIDAPPFNQQQQECTWAGEGVNDEDWHLFGSTDLVLNTVSLEPDLSARTDEDLF